MTPLDSICDELGWKLKWDRSESQDNAKFFVAELVRKSEAVVGPATPMLLVKLSSYWGYKDDVVVVDIDSKGYVLGMEYTQTHNRRTRIGELGWSLEACMRIALEQANEWWDAETRRLTVVPELALESQVAPSGEEEALAYELAAVMARYGYKATRAWGIKR